MSRWKDGRTFLLRFAGGSHNVLDRNPSESPILASPDRDSL